MAGVYLERDGEYVAMTETKFAAEAELQELLATNSELLAGDEIDSQTPRRFVLIKREAGVPDDTGTSDRWSIDHLFVDQGAIPTLVEVKRAGDTRVRREVVAQMLDYAANMPVTWDQGRMRAEFEATCEQRDEDPTQQIVDLVGGEAPPEEIVDKFWDDAETNFRSGRLRLLFVADGIPLELQRIIEFLNQQMSPAVVLGIDVGRYVSADEAVDVGQVIVSNVVGNTAAAQSTKRRSSGRVTTYEDGLVDVGETFLRAAALLDGWAEDHGAEPYNEGASRRYVVDGLRIGCLYPREQRLELTVKGLADGPARNRVLAGLREVLGVEPPKNYPRMDAADIVAKWAIVHSEVLDPLLEAWR